MDFTYGALQNDPHFFSGLQFVEPVNNADLFDKKVFRTFNGSVGAALKIAGFALLLTRLYLNCSLILGQYMGRDVVDHERREMVQAGFCSSLLGDVDARGRCLEEMLELTKKYHVDQGDRFAMMQTIVFKSETFLFWSNAGMALLFGIVGLYQVCINPHLAGGYTHLLSFRKVIKRLAGISALKALIFMNVDCVTLYWGTEWLSSIRSMYMHSTWNRKIRGPVAVMTMMVGVVGLIGGLEAFQVKMLSIQHLMYLDRQNWGFQEWREFLSFVNVVMSIVDVADIRASRVMLFAFGGRDSLIDCDESEKRGEYHGLVLASVRKQFPFRWFFVVVMQHDDNDLQKIMVDDRGTQLDASGQPGTQGDDNDQFCTPGDARSQLGTPGDANDQLLGNAKEDPRPLIILVTSAVLVGIGILIPKLRS